MHIDLWTLALQTINVLVLVWLLARFLFRPVAAVIAARRAAADALMTEADAARAKVAAEAAALDRQRQNIAVDSEHMLAAARTIAEAERGTILRQADEATTRLRAEAQQAITRDQQAMRESLEHEAADLAVTIARRLLERIPAQVLTTALIEGLADALATHPARAMLLNGPVEVRSATLLDPSSQDQCRQMLTRLLGRTPDLQFHTEPNLLAGLELISRQAVIRNSWQADLERIIRDLHEDARDAVPADHVA